MRHTYLFENAFWEARGVYRDAAGRQATAEGYAVVSVGPEICTVHGQMRVIGSLSVEFANRYDIVPFGPRAVHTTWVSENPDLGRLEGRFIIVGDTILSSFVTADGMHSGVESLHQKAEDAYENRGALYRGTDLLSTWSVALSRQSEMGEA